MRFRIDAGRWPRPLTDLPRSWERPEAPCYGDVPVEVAPRERERWSVSGEIRDAR